MHISPFHALLPHMDLIPSPGYFFATVREEFAEYYGNGFFDRQDKNGIYLYQITGQLRDYLGLIACVDVQDYLDGAIKKHEQTIADQEQKQMQLTIKRKAGVKPVLLTYPEVPDITAWMHQAILQQAPTLEINFEEESQLHRLWAISDDTSLHQLKSLFLDKVPVTYIADGHHRIASTALMHQKTDENHYGQLFAALFSSAELEILDFNRVLEMSEDISAARFMARLSEVCHIECLNQAIRPDKKHSMVMYLQRDWYRLEWKTEVFSGGTDLDAALLNEKVLRDILGIFDVRNDTRVHYVEGPKGLDGLRNSVHKYKNAVGFALFPIQLSDLFRLADAGEMLPPKSTWFEPRMKNGMIVQEF